MKVHMNCNLVPGKVFIACGAKGNNLKTVTTDEYTCKRCDAVLNRETKGTRRGWI